MRKLWTVLLVCVLAAVSMSCASNEDTGGEATDAPADATPSLSIGDVEDSVKGNVVTLPVDVEGIEIVSADGDTSGETGHFHVFIDRDPVDVGEVIPKERGVVHSTDNPIKIWGLEPGEHEFNVVLGDGAHGRILEDVEDSVTVDVEGPGIQGSAPATVEEGEDVTVEIASEGVEIVAADGSASTESGHYHVIVDPASPPQAGKVIPAANDETIFHTTEDAVDVPDLAQGEHTIWVVLGNGSHEAFDPPVMDKLTVVVE